MPAACLPSDGLRPLVAAVPAESGCDAVHVDVIPLAAQNNSSSLCELVMPFIILSPTVECAVKSDVPAVKALALLMPCTSAMHIRGSIAPKCHCFGRLAAVRGPSPAYRSSLASGKRMALMSTLTQAANWCTSYWLVMSNRSYQTWL